MLQEFWDCFMETGQIDMYLNYKAYDEEVHRMDDQHLSESEVK